MVKSMTGYGRARETRNKRDITVEVRSVNNRYLDCTVKLPRAYVFAEDAIKGRVQKAVSRGKVDVFVTIEASAADVSVVTVNQPLARGYYQALTQLRDMFSLEGEITPMALAKLPDVLTVSKAEEDLETVAADICRVLDQALAAYNDMRAVEGRRLAEDIAGGLVVTMPSQKDFHSDTVVGRNGETIGEICHKFFVGREGVKTEDRQRIMRFIENLCLGAAAVGYRTESMHGAGSPQAQRIMIARQGNIQGKKQLAKDIAGIVD